MPNCSLAFIAELDHRSTGAELKLSKFLHRHWPGPGSWAMGWILSPFGAQCLQSEKWLGRCGGLHLKLPLCSVGNNTNPKYEEHYIIGAHAPHTTNEFIEFMLNLAELYHAKPDNSRVTCVGDWNCNLLTGNQTIDLNLVSPDDNLGILTAFMDQIGMHLQVPRPSLCKCGGRYRHEVQRAPISRIPTGSDENYVEPTLLDYPFFERPETSSSRLSWRRVHGDHAFLFVYLSSALSRPKHVATSWRPRSFNEALRWCHSNNIGPNFSVTSFLAFTVQMMKHNKDPKSRAQRNRDLFQTRQHKRSQFLLQQRTEHLATRTQQRSTGEMASTRTVRVSADSSPMTGAEDDNANNVNHFSYVNPNFENSNIGTLPLQVRELYSRAECAQVHYERKILLTQAAALLKHHYERKQAKKARYDSTMGFLHRSASKLFNVRAIIASAISSDVCPVGTVTSDRQIWQREAYATFSKRWGVSDLHTRSILMSMVDAYEGCAFRVAPSDVYRTFDSIKTSNRIDANGVSTSALRILALAEPNLTTDIIQQVLSYSRHAASFTVRGLLRGKSNGITAAEDLRAILAQPPILEVADFLTAKRLRTFLDGIFGENPSIFHGARAGTQTLDISTAIHLVMEKAQDGGDAGAVAESDIKSFYDRISLLRSVRWLINRDCPNDLIGPILRLQLLPNITLALGNTRIRIDGRTLGVMTGSRLAGELGRIPVESTIQECLPQLERYGFRTDSRILCVCTFVDNIFNFSTSSLGATAMGDLFEQTLFKNWQLSIKEGSRKVTSADNSHEVSSPSWEVVQLMRPLGHVVDHRCRAQVAARPTFRIMWGAFFAKMTDKRLQHLHLEQRVVELNRYIWPLLAYRCSGWPVNTLLSKSIDAIQLKMVALLLRVAPWPDEAMPSFYRRRAKSASALIAATFKWSDAHMRRFVKWHQHCVRNSSNRSFNLSLIQFRDDDWLQRKREPFVPLFTISARAFTKYAGRTGTRSSRGGPPTRWETAYKATAYLVEALPKPAKKYRGIKPNAFLPAEGAVTRISVP